MALNRTQEGQLALRALSGGNATAVIDTAAVRVENNVRHTSSLAGKLLLLLAGVVAGRLLLN